MRAWMAVSLLVILGTSIPAAIAERQSSKPETASQYYLRFRTTALNAKSIDEITAFWSAALMHEFNLMPDADKPATLEMVKRIEAMTTDVKVVKETTTPAGATLTLEGIGPDKSPMVGSVDLVKENGAWKIAEQETWRPKGADSGFAIRDSR
jgi:hypothetical protein